ncbi:MAG: hypothetical protein HC888_06525 [Candidatus Competibacteraceae bacterium]|nr:hypothetical protein [Candidatus Competibacteraceae bacterium]
MTFLILILWVIAALFAYLLARRECRSLPSGKWTQADRIFWLIFCTLCGPMMLVVVLIGLLATKIANTPWARREVRW